MTRRTGVLVAAIVALAAALGWWLWGGGDERAIRNRLAHLRDLANATAPEGLGTISHAVEIGSFFTEDVLIEFGEGSSPVRGRETLIGMAARLQPRTQAFEVRLDDVTVSLKGDETADVTLTVLVTHRNAAEEESMDASEFALVMRNDGEWRIARATAVQPLKR